MRKALPAYNRAPDRHMSKWPGDSRHRFIEILPSQDLPSPKSNRTIEFSSVLVGNMDSASNLWCLTRHSPSSACYAFLITRPKQSIGRLDSLNHFASRFSALLGLPPILTYFLHWVYWASTITPRIRLAIIRLGGCIDPCTSRHSALPTSALVKLWPFKPLTDDCGRESISTLP
jgi:hypothetical protein